MCPENTLTPDLDETNDVVDEYFCAGNQPVTELQNGIHSSNINGPGSG